MMTDYDYGNMMMQNQMMPNHMMQNQMMGSNMNTGTGSGFSKVSTHAHRKNSFLFWFSGD
jgi:hypothetical protein